MQVCRWIILVTSGERSGRRVQETVASNGPVPMLDVSFRRHSVIIVDVKKLNEVSNCSTDVKRATLATTLQCVSLALEL